MWQGYQAQDFEAVGDLKEIKEIKLINSTFLQDIKSWIFFPANVTFFASSDGVNYAKVFESKSLLPDDSYDIKVQEFKTKPQNLKARYIKVVAKTYGKLPVWHISSGNDSWMFIDEIEIL